MDHDAITLPPRAFHVPALTQKHSLSVYGQRAQRSMAIATCYKPYLSDLMRTDNAPAGSASV
jgi:hypothetical protein